jgi:hypothetical protein
MSVENGTGPIQIIEVFGPSSPEFKQHTATAQRDRLKAGVRGLFEGLLDEPAISVPDDSPSWSSLAATPESGPADSSVQGYNQAAQNTLAVQSDPGQPSTVPHHRSNRVRAGLKTNKHRQEKDGPHWSLRKRALAILPIASITMTGFFLGYELGDLDKTSPPSQSQGLSDTEYTIHLPQLEFENQPDLSANATSDVKQLLRGANLVLATYEPLVMQAAQDPRTGNPNTLPNHQDETILLLALLLQGDPNNASGPIPIPDQASNPVFTELVQQMNDTNVAEGLNLPLLQSDEKNIKTNLMAAILQIRLVYQVWSNNKANTGQSVDDFVKYYFGKTVGPVAMSIYSALGSRYNLPLQKELTSSTAEAGNIRTSIEATIDDLVGDGLITAPSGN